MNTFTPNVSVIAGVGPGLGASLARKFAKEGCRLAVLARSADFLETLSKELRRHGTEILSIPTAMDDDMPVGEERQLEDYQRLSDLFQFYLELVFKAFTFAIGIAGGVSAFVLGKDVHDRCLAAYGLLLPAVLCIGMRGAFLRAVRSSRELNAAMQKLKSSLHCTLAPHATNLTPALNP